MTTYCDAGVDVSAGDDASRIARGHAARTFAARQGRIGAPPIQEEGFAGLLDMGGYFLAQTDDGTGTKMDIALSAGNVRMLGCDLLAMVADDLVCTGAEVLSVSNTLDLPRIDRNLVDALLSGLADACIRERIVISAGEIAEVPGTVNAAVWNATAVGIVAKDRLLRSGHIEPGDTIIALRERGARSNGFSLIRHILREHLGERYWAKERDGQTWGEAILTPSTVYHGAILTLLGRHNEPRAIPVKALAHITGGGIPSKLRRVLRSGGCGAHISSLWGPPAFLVDIARMGDVVVEEAYRAWSMGNGMLLVLPSTHADDAIRILARSNIDAKVAGEVTRDPCITLTAFDGTILRF